MRRLLCRILIFMIAIGFAGCKQAEKDYVSDDVIQTYTDDILTEQTKQEDKAKESLPLADIIICIDAGHGKNSYNKQELIAPNSLQTKIAFASGTSGKNQTEEELNLIIALKLESKLKALGATVYMTRTTHESDMTNIDRAEFANAVYADISVKIHADGIENSSVHGVSMLVPSNQYINNQSICDESIKAGEIILEEVVNSTGAVNRGVMERNDLTGFNWTKVPVVLLEMGFMTNPEEDAKMETEEYQQKIVDGIVSGLLKYFEYRQK